MTLSQVRVCSGGREPTWLLVHPCVKCAVAHDGKLGVSAGQGMANLTIYTQPLRDYV